MTTRRRPLSIAPPGPRLACRAGTLLAIAGLLVGGGAGVAAAPGSAAPASPASASKASTPSSALGLSRVVSGLVEPLFVTDAGDSRLFVVERTGRIRILRKVHGSWHITGTFLDLRGHVQTGYGEQGLLGLAFHPDYATNGRFYVDYTDLAGDTIVAEYRRASHGKAEPSSRRRLLKVHQPTTTTTAAGSASRAPTCTSRSATAARGGDPGNRAQDLGTLLGKMLRIDPLDPDGAGPKRYRIPADNPFVGTRRARRDLGLRPAQPVARQLRPAHRRPVDRRRGPGPLRGGRPCRQRQGAQLRLAPGRGTTSLPLRRALHIELPHAARRRVCPQRGRSKQLRGGRRVRRATPWCGPGGTLHLRRRLLRTYLVHTQQLPRR